MCESAIVERISLIYEGSKKRKDCKAVPGFNTLRSYSKSKRSDNWHKLVSEFNNKMQTGFDVRTKDKRRQKDLEREHGVKMKDEDYKLYEDNCKIKTCECDWNAAFNIKCSDCPRKMFTTDIIDNEWKKYHDRKLKNTTHESIQKRTDEYRISNTDDNNTSSKIMKFNCDVEMDIEELADKSDENFVMKVAPDLLKTPHSKEWLSHHI